MYALCTLSALVAASECPTSSCDPASLLVPIPAEIHLATGTAPVDGPVSEVLDQSLTELGDEGYRLYCHQEGYQIGARTKAGVFYGRRTLDQMERLGLIPCCTVTDKPVMKMRAVMLDLARLKEKHEYYHEAVDQLAKWKINTVFLHLTDHSGCALQFEGYPGLATRYAFSQNEMKRLIEYASNRHIELIPEIETWGHSKYITTVPEFADLAEDPKDPRALCTSNPRTWEVLGHIIDEVAALFPSKYLHLGCDEAAFGKCEDCIAKAERDGVDALVGEHLKRACDLAKARGKTPMIWGDVLLQHRGSVDSLSRDTVICHWDYRPQATGEPVEFLKSRGFDVVGCPAIVWGSRMILPRTDTLDNVSSFAKIAQDCGCLGMETTVWVPQRYITDTLWFSLAYASELSWSGPRRTRLEFAAAFAKEYFGIDPTTELAQALLDVHSLSMKSFAKLQDPWKFTEECAKAGGEDRQARLYAGGERAGGIAGTISAYRPRVAHHEAEFDALVLAADVRAYVEERGVALLGLAKLVHSADKLTPHQAAEAAHRLIPALEELRERNDDLTRRLEADWDRWRYADDPKKHDGGENLLGGFYSSTRFFDTVIPRLKDAGRRCEKGESVDWHELIERPEAEQSAFTDTGDVVPA